MVAGIFWQTSWSLLFPSASSLPSSLPSSPRLFPLPGSSHCRRHRNCFLKCFCSYHHIVHVGLLIHGCSSTEFAYPGCVLTDVRSTSEMRGKKVQQGDLPGHISRFQWWCRASLLIYEILICFALIISSNKPLTALIPPRILLRLAELERVSAKHLTLCCQTLTKQSLYRAHPDYVSC